MVDNAFGSYIGKPNTSPVGWNMAHQVLTWLLISLFLYAAGPASGGHLNPFITMLTFTAGLCTLPRMVYYIIGQMVGALGGAFFLKLGLGGSRNYYPSVRTVPCA
jgi:glycerol uptake facilitator-like aquaporin